MAMDINVWFLITPTLLLIVAVLCELALVRRWRRVAADWRDLYAGELRAHTSTREALDALKQSHRELQADFLAQGRDLTLARGLVSAAERLS